MNLQKQKPKEKCPMFGSILKDDKRSPALSWLQLGKQIKSGYI
jgi:hypothetical protein